MMSERASVLPGNRRLNSKREGKADDELEEEGSGGEQERVDDCAPARGVVKDEAVVGEPGERGAKLAIVAGEVRSKLNITL